MTQLIISEKPNAASKLAEALGDFKKVGAKVYYFEGKIGATHAYIVPAVGHLFGLAESKKRQGYPALEVEWVPTYKKSSFTKPYFDQFKKLAKEADDIIIATDYDREGEVIGYNILQFIFKKKDAKRMKFSTLMASDLQEAYKTAAPHLDLGQANAGLARHHLDFLYGISLSKAATSAASLATNSFRPLSIGRVQGPSLAILAKREKEILAFKPVPYWQIFANLDLKDKPFEAVHEKDRFWDKADAYRIFEYIKDKPATISDIKKVTKVVPPPFPFDLTSLQIEAYRCFGTSPKQTLVIAQKLYTAALISYPRTSSQKLPPAIGYSKILKKLASQQRFTDEANLVLQGKLIPTEGAKTDSAHPAIYPTGERPKSLPSDELMLYDLIVRRFLACFGKAGEREFTTVRFDIAGEPFILKGARTTKIEWQRLYFPYSKAKELELPTLKVGEVYSEETKIEGKETQPPKRYTPASIIKELEKNNLGTKATRANIIDILYRRNYVEDQKIKVTKLGLAVVDTFAKYAPDILSAELTAKFEIAMDKIQDKSLSVDTVLNKAKAVLIKICAEFNAHKPEIGESLGKALQVTEDKQRMLMICPKCTAGTIRIIRSKATRKVFAACDGYPDCKTTYPLVQNALIKPTKNTCKECGTVILSIVRKGKRPFQMCIDPKCKTKENWGKK